MLSSHICFHALVAKSQNIRETSNISANIQAIPIFSLPLQVKNLIINKFGTASFVRLFVCIVFSGLVSGKLF